AWHTWEAGGGHADLCCGLAGRAYALLNFDRHAGSGVTRHWQGRARELAEQAAAAALHSPGRTPDSLYKGTVGVAVLAADLWRPGAAAMPFFEDEGWETTAPAPSR
nr:hypothetical protein [Acidobacteriota bacterium]